MRNIKNKLNKTNYNNIVNPLTNSDTAEVNLTELPVFSLTTRDGPSQDPNIYKI